MVIMFLHMPYARLYCNYNDIYEITENKHVSPHLYHFLPFPFAMLSCLLFLSLARALVGGLFLCQSSEGCRDPLSFRDRRCCGAGGLGGEVGGGGLARSRLVCVAHGHCVHLLPVWLPVLGQGQHLHHSHSCQVYCIILDSLVVRAST